MRNHVSQHEGSVLSLLRDRGPLSRTELATACQLSPTTMSRTTARLLDRGWVEELTHTVPAVGAGRPAVPLRQRPEAISVLGVQIGVGRVDLGVADAWARVSTWERLTFDPAEPAEQVLERVAERAAELVENVPASAPVLAVGVGAPGPVDAHRRRNVMSLNLGWRDVDVAGHLQRTVDLPVVVDHNVRAMALAEARYGANRSDYLALVYARTGVGLGLVLGGQPFFGGVHGVSELGHSRVADAGQCVCGATGCLETVVGEPALRRRLSEIGIVSGPSPLSDLERNVHLPEVAEFRSTVLVALSRGLAGVVNLVSPEIILLGGLLGRAPDSFHEALLAHTREEVFPLLRADLRIAPASLDKLGVAGGAATGLEWVVYSRG